MKATATAPSNIAFIKYWGRKDETLRLPENGSLSMNLSALQTTTTVEFSPDYTEDRIEINGTREPNESGRAVKHLDRVRALAKISDFAKVVTKNNFPTGTGLSSSASGFAALTVAAASAAGLQLSEKDLSILARQGSGSACRSISDGFVEWLDGDTSDTSYATSLYPPDYWDLVDVVAVVSEGKKDVSTSEGQKVVGSSPFFPVRRAHIKEKLEQAKTLLASRNFPEFGELIETEALELHAVMLTSRPPLIYWTSGTLTIMKLCKKWRTEGLQVYFTINTGQDIHLICERKNRERVKSKLADVEGVKEVIVNFPAVGARISDGHLF
ncbi:diphosphomevalonate decarboxylase [Candidatus Kaiserbacteria bacterium]|nr:diphosphomevalonate decarboxylase [Candidatus Kaiserbacteria bacterium]